MTATASKPSTRDSQRTSAIHNLAALNTELDQTIPQLNSAIAAATNELTQARIQAQKIIDDAEMKVITATNAKRAALLPIERQRDEIVTSLEGHLQPACIATALQAVEKIRESNRRGEDYKRQGSVLLWCDSARAELLELQFSLRDDLPEAVADILASQP